MLLRVPMSPRWALEERLGRDAPGLTQLVQDLRRGPLSLVATESCRISASSAIMCRRSRFNAAFCQGPFLQQTLNEVDGAHLPQERGVES